MPGALSSVPKSPPKLSRMGEKIAEVPVAYNPRSASEGKKIRHSDGWLVHLDRFSATASPPDPAGSDQGTKPLRSQ